MKKEAKLKVHKQCKLVFDMFDGYNFHLHVVDDLELFSMKEFEIEAGTDTAAVFTVPDEYAIHMVLSVKALKEKGLSIVVHECTHYANNLELATGIEDEEFHAYCVEHFFKLIVKQLNKWGVRYKVV